MEECHLKDRAISKDKYVVSKATHYTSRLSEAEEVARHFLEDACSAKKGVNVGQGSYHSKG